MNKEARFDLSYYEREDILHIALSSEGEFGSLELAPDITAELNEEGRLIGLEIIGASLFFDRFS